jgi:hypothetical protein
VISDRRRIFRSNILPNYEWLNGDFGFKKIGGFKKVVTAKLIGAY